MKKFQLYHQDKYLGDLEFKNNQYLFKLSSSISPQEWEDIYGIIPITNNRESSSDHFFEQLNVRFPLILRKIRNDKKKWEYIEKNHLRVASDSYELRPVLLSK